MMLDIHGIEFTGWSTSVRSGIPTGTSSSAIAGGRDSGQSYRAVRVVAKQSIALLKVAMQQAKNITEDLK